MSSLRMLPVAVAAIAVLMSACEAVQPILQPPVDAGLSEGTKPPPKDGWQYLSGAPTAVGYPLTGQNELRTAKHWEILAADAVKGFIEARAKHPGSDRPVFVDLPDPGMPFALAFHGYLVTQLLGRGQRVVLTRAGADRIHYSVQPVIHEYGSTGPPLGVLSLFGVGAGVAERFGGVVSTAIIGGLLAEAVIGKHPATRLLPFSEVVITVSLVRGDALLARASATYYVDHREMAQYLPSMPPQPLIVQAWADQGKPMSVRSFRVVSSVE